MAARGGSGERRVGGGVLEAEDHALAGDLPDGKGIVWHWDQLRLLRKKRGGAWLSELLRRRRRARIVRRRKKMAERRRKRTLDLHLCACL